MASEFDMNFTETSAQEDLNIEDVFLEMMKDIKEKHDIDSIKY